MNVIDVIRLRRSVRSYSSVEIPADVTERLLESIRYAPSACNNQPWRFILVRKMEHRVAVATVCREQAWMAAAPMIIVACGVPAEAYQRMGGQGNSTDVDVAIAIDHLTLAAAELGLGTCWIGAFDENGLKDLLGVPPEVRIIALTPLGYPADKDALKKALAKKRKSPDAVFMNEKWQK